MATASVEEYLEAIYKLEELKEKVKSVQLAQQLGVSAPSVAEMTKKMADLDLIKKDAKAGVRLSPKGKKLALQMIRRHRLSERFLVDILGLSWDKVHAQACKFEHVISPEVESAIERALNDPGHCPHGYPIPDKEGNIVLEETVQLTKLKPGEKAVIAYVMEDDGEALKYFTKLSLLPGAQVMVQKVEPFGGPVNLSVDGKKISLGIDAAKLIFLTKR